MSRVDRLARRVAGDDGVRRPTRVVEHREAGELFSRYSAKLYLDQVLAKKQILKA